MLVIMSGLPRAGKSTIARKFAEIGFTVLNPEEYYPDNIQFDESSKAKFAIAAWEVCHQTAMNMVEDSTGNIIFDTSASNANPILPLINKAKECGHQIITLFVVSSEIEAQKRPGWPGHSIFINYLDKFKISANEIKDVSDKYIIIKNNENLDKFLSQAHKIIGDLNGKVARIY